MSRGDAGPWSEPLRRPKLRRDSEATVLALALLDTRCLDRLASAGVIRFDPLRAILAAARSLVARLGGSRIDFALLRDALRASEEGDTESRAGVDRELGELRGICETLLDRERRGLSNEDGWYSFDQRVAAMRKLDADDEYDRALAEARRLQDRGELDNDGYADRVAQARLAREGAGCGPPPVTLADLAGDPADLPDRRFLSGVQWFDRRIGEGGIAPGELVIISADSNLGKTTLAVQWLLGLLESNEELVVLWAGGEMSPRAMYLRALRTIAHLPVGRLRRPSEELTPQERERKARALRIAKRIGRRLHFHEGPPTLASVRSTALRVRAHVVVIDYFQLFEPSGAEGVHDPTRRLDLAAHETLALAARDGFAVLCVSAATSGRHETSGRPTLQSATRGSGMLGYDAHTVLALYRPKPSKGDGDTADQSLVRLACLKNREGELGDDLDLRLEGAIGTFRPADEEAIP